jgi:uncharacterized membrane protein YfcA
MQIVQFVIVGLLAGVLAGLLGIGGAIFVIPVLVYIFGWEQHVAQGTTLAMLIPPIGILAAWKYYEAGNMDLKVAGILCIGFFFGGYIGGWLANQLPAETLRKAFGVFLLLVSVKMILGK